MKFALQLLGLVHKACGRLADCLDTAVGLSLKSSEVLGQVADARAEVPLGAEACCLLLGHLGLNTKKLESKLAAAFLEPCCVESSAGLSRHYPCRG